MSRLLGDSDGKPGTKKTGKNVEIAQTEVALDEPVEEEALQDDTLLDILQNDLDAPPLDVAANAPGAIGGGTSTYQSDFGELIDGLEANDGGTAQSGTRTPGNRLASLDLGSDGSSFPPGAGNTETDPEVPVEPPIGPEGPGPDEPLFTKNDDNVDLNSIDVGGYKDGTQYNADNGNDIVILPSNVSEALEAGFAPGTLFRASNGNDQVTGGTLDDLIDGGKGHDLLVGGDGEDSLWGNTGNDSLTGGEGDDSLFGGNDDDTLNGGPGQDRLDGGGSNDSLTGGSGDDSLVGSHGRDTLLGGDGSDLVEGGKGNDSIDGGSGSDLLIGDIGSDLLIGGAGDDTLRGGVHNDTLNGGTDDDVMTGGDGRDTFSFSLAGNEGDDLILDFMTTGSSRDTLEIANLTDVNGDGVIDVDDLDAGGNSVTGSVVSVVISFDTGSLLTMDGVDGTGVSSFNDLLDINVDIDIV